MNPRAERIAYFIGFMKSVTIQCTKTWVGALKKAWKGPNS